MVKKTLLMVALLAIITVIPAYSFGIGAAFGLDVTETVGPGALLSLRLDSFPAVFGVGWSAKGDFQLGLTADWWLFHTNLVSILSLYVGPGLYLDLGITGGTASLGIGVRVPVGLQAWIIDPLELFLELAPTFGMKDGQFPRLGIQGALGFRFWF